VKRLLIVVFIFAAFTLASCHSPQPITLEDEAPSAPVMTQTPVAQLSQNVTVPVETPVPEPAPLFTDEDLYAIALTLSGECYDNEVQDKRDVAWVICNRVRDGCFGSGIIGVVSSTQYGVQFVGYWKQSRSISDSDYEIAREVLTAHFNGEQSPHDYLYFSGGTGFTNTFK
jgi:spore germination cell wall hydrolase CwlJ-like protein